MGARSFPSIAGQSGLATRSQLRAAGWTGSAIRHALTTRWSQVLPGVVAEHRGPLDAATFTVAAGLWAGQGAVLTGGAALEVFGLKGSYGREPLLFVVPRTQRDASAPGAIRRRTSRPPQVAHRRRRVAIAPPARALLDLARYGAMGPDDLEALTIAALQQHVTTPDLLGDELAACHRNHLAAVRRGLGLFRNGAWSRPEAALRQLLETLPQPPVMHFNVRLHTEGCTVIGTPDCYLSEYGAVLQVHSETHHRGTDDLGRDLWTMTVSKDNAYVLHGVAVLGVTPNSLAREPERCRTEVVSLVKALAGRPLPRVHVAGAYPCRSGASDGYHHGPLHGGDGQDT